MMKKILLCVVTVLAGAGFAQAQFPAGAASSEVDSNGTTVYRDANGILIGTADVDSNGTINYRDANGILSGTADVDSNGRTVYRNE